MTATATKAPWNVSTEPMHALPSQRHWGRRFSLGLIAAGSAAILAASGLAFNLATGDGAPAPASPSASATVATTAAAQAPAASAAAETFPNVGLAESVYPAGHSSGWHVHPGVHSVVVRTGTLTIYDEVCGRSDYGPGESYIGGDRAHVARNEGGEPLDVVITYVYVRSTTADHGRLVAAPVGCDVR